MIIKGKKSFYIMLVSYIAVYCVMFFFIFGNWSFSLMKINFKGPINLINEKSSELITLNETRKRLSVKSGLLRNLEGEFAAVKDKIPETNNSIYDKEKGVDFFVMLETLAERAGITKALNSDPKIIFDAAVGSNVLAVQMEIEGSYGNILNFINLLQNSPWSLILGKIEISKNETVPVSGGIKNQATSSTEDIKAFLEVKILSR